MDEKDEKDEKNVENEKNELLVKVSPIKFTVEKDGIEYEFTPIGEITDIVKLKDEIAKIMKHYNIVVRSKNIVVIPKSEKPTKQSFEEDYLKSKEQIREWYREDPEKGWTANDLMEAVKFPKIRRSAVMTKLVRENYIKCINPLGSRNERKYIKAEALIVPEAAEKRNLKQLEEERRVHLDVLG